MENDWISLLKQMEEIKNNTMLMLKVYSDESGSIEYNDDRELLDFISYDDLEAQVEKLEHDNKYKKFYDIIETFTREDFFNTDDTFEKIRRRAIDDNKR